MLEERVNINTHKTAGSKKKELANMIGKLAHGFIELKSKDAKRQELKQQNKNAVNHPRPQLDPRAQPEAILPKTKRIKRRRKRDQSHRNQDKLQDQAGEAMHEWQKQLERR